MPRPARRAGCARCPASIHGAPTVMAGLVYLATCGFCGQQRRRATRRAGRTAPTRSTRAPGKLVWTFPDGQYSPIVADGERVYLTGAAAGLRARSSARSSPLSEQERATAIPVSGQTRYDVWKTRAMKRRTKIETAKPAAASQSRPERRTSPDEPRRHRQPDEEREQRERVGAVAVVDDAGVQEQRREPVAEDAVGARPVADRVAPERARRRRSGTGGSRRASDRGEGRGRARSSVCAREPAREQHDDEERQRDERELLQQDRGGERDRRPREARAGQQARRRGAAPRMLGASAVPNQAPRTSSGLAASAAPTARRHGSGASKRSTAKKQPIVASRTSTR